MRARQIAEHITAWLLDYAETAGSRGFVVGISGGIDSAVTSTLAAMTKRPLLAVTMPIHQNVSQLQRARDHIAWLKKRYDNTTAVEVELTSVLDALVRALPEPHSSAEHELSLVNARARLRMTTLYYFSALDRDLVVGTGNKVEDFGVGFYTKYGDGGVDLSPIADLTKTEVFALGQSLGVGEDILNAAPTDGLWGDERTDEDQIGATYPELEWAMDFTGEPNSLNPRQREVLAIYRRLNAANRHKMLPIPVCEIPPTLR